MPVEGKDSQTYNDRTPSTTTTTVLKPEARKNNKPIMEKRRRARINKCLNELKLLILKATKKDSSNYSKLEKADILEMTVRYLRNLQKQQLSSITCGGDTAVLCKFRHGFKECADEIVRYISCVEGIDPSFRHRILTFVSSRMENLRRANAASVIDDSGFPTDFADSLLETGSAASGLSNSYDVSLRPELSHSLRKNNALSFGSLRLIPTRLPTGEIAFILPQSCDLPASLSNVASTDCPLSSRWVKLASERQNKENSIAMQCLNDTQDCLNPCNFSCDNFSYTLAYKPKNDMKEEDSSSNDLRISRSKPLIETKNLNTSLLSSTHYAALSDKQCDPRKKIPVIGSANGAFSIYRSHKNISSSSRDIQKNESPMIRINEENYSTGMMNNARHDSLQKKAANHNIMKCFDQYEHVSSKNFITNNDGCQSFCLKAFNTDCAPIPTRNVGSLSSFTEQMNHESIAYMWRPW